MKLVVSTLMGIILTLYFMYYFFPLLTTEHAQTTLLFNATDPDIALSYTFGAGFLAALPFIPILVGLFVLFAYALKRSMYD
jgi:hypothetical protein